MKRVVRGWTDQWGERDVVSTVRRSRPSEVAHRHAQGGGEPPERHRFYTVTCFDSDKALLEFAVFTCPPHRVEEQLFDYRAGSVLSMAAEIAEERPLTLADFADLLSTKMQWDREREMTDDDQLLRQSEHATRWLFDHLREVRERTSPEKTQKSMRRVTEDVRRGKGNPAGG